MTRFSDQFAAYMATRRELTDFVVGEWLATLALAEFDALSDLVERVMYPHECRVSEDEIRDVMRLAESAHLHEVMSNDTLAVAEIEQIAMNLELAVWMEFARRENIFAVPGGISLVEMGEAHVLVTRRGVPSGWADGGRRVLH